MVELRFGPDFEGVEPHSHADHVDSFYVLEGEAEFVMGDETVRLGPGSYVAAPIGVVHGFRNVGDGELRMLERPRAEHRLRGAAATGLSVSGILGREALRMNRTFYVLIGWVAWRSGKRAIRRKLHLADR